MGLFVYICVYVTIRQDGYFPEIIRVERLKGEYSLPIEFYVIQFLLINKDTFLKEGYVLPGIEWPNCHVIYQLT